MPSYIHTPTFSHGEPSNLYNFLTDLEYVRKPCGRWPPNQSHRKLASRARAGKAEASILINLAHPPPNKKKRKESFPQAETECGEPSRKHMAGAPVRANRH